MSRSIKKTSPVVSETNFVSNKKEVPAALLEGIEHESLMIVSMKVLIKEIKELIVIENQTQSIVLKVEQNAAASKDEAESNELSPNTFNQGGALEA